MSLTTKAILRDFQTRATCTKDLKLGLQRAARQILNRPFEAEYGVLKHIAEDGGDFVDVGSNRGQSIDAIRLFHPNVSIHAFEPNGALSEHLLQRYDHDKNLTIHNYGLGQAYEEQTLYVPSYRDYVYDGLSSFNPVRAETWLSSETVWRFDPAQLKIKRYPCHITRLDEYRLKPTFLKVHTQGFELECLIGGEETISCHSPVILIANHAEADQWLRSRKWMQFAYKRNQLLLLNENDTALYNVVYLHPQNPAHQDLITRLCPA